MRSVFWMTGLMLGTLIGVLNQGEAALAKQPLPKPPAYYVGVGVRAGFNDEAAAVINSKVKLTDVGDITLSARPALLLGSDTEFRLPFTVEGSVTQRLYPYGGVGLAYNADGLKKVDPMLTAGVDIGVVQHFVVGIAFNLIFQTAISDTDTEFAASFNYSF